MEIPLDRNENDESLYKKEVTDKEIETMGQCKSYSFALYRILQDFP
jgi:hypothetical protein